MYSPKPNPDIKNPDVQALANYLQEELQAIARAMGETQELELRPSAKEPEKPREGMIVYADGVNWNPGSGAGSYQYVGGVWVLQRSGAEPNTYGVITDGTNNAPADIAADTFKLRGTNGVKVTVTNDDATHGDNALHEMDIGSLSSVAPALDDKIPFGDTSASNAVKRLTPQTLLDLIGSLTTDSAPDYAADFLPSYDASAAVAKKIAIPRGPILLSTTSLNAATVDITLPSGYTDLLLVVRNGGVAATTTLNIAFSENAGSSFQNQSYYLTVDGANQIGGPTTPGPWSLLNDVGTSSSIWAQIRLLNYTTSGKKATLEHIMHSSSNRTLVGGRTLVSSTAALNLARFTCAGGTAYNNGSVDLYGLP